MRTVYGSTEANKLCKLIYSFYSILILCVCYFLALLVYDNSSHYLLLLVLLCTCYILSQLKNSFLCLLALFFFFYSFFFALFFLLALLAIEKQKEIIAPKDVWRKTVSLSNITK